MNFSKLCTKSYARLNNQSQDLLIKNFNKYNNIFCTKSFRTKKSSNINNSDITIVDKHNVFTEELSLKRLFRPTLFTIGTGAICYVGCSILSYESYLTRSKNLMDRFKQTFNINDNYRPSEPEWRKKLREQWNKLSEGEKIFVPICFLNIIVTLMWRIPKYQSVMFKYFASNPQSKSLCFPMLSSVFSHISPFHIGANMFVLHSFISNVTYDLGIEQFIGFYITGGVAASLFSFFGKVATRTGGISVGASGAILAVLGHMCMKHPENDLGIIFIPNFRFKADTGLYGIMLLDLCGLLFGWKLFDHAAHLGGALFGVFYAKYGDEMWNKRYIIVDQWKTIREGSKKDQ